MNLAALESYFNGSERKTCSRLWSIETQQTVHHAVDMTETNVSPHFFRYDEVLY